MSETNDKPPHLEPGLYRHYKGGVYEVLFVARDTENEGKWRVIYHALGNAAIKEDRPYDMFMETVIVDGVEVPRFKPATDRLL